MMLSKMNGDEDESSIKSFPSNRYAPIPFPSISLIQARLVLFFVSVICFVSSWDGEFVFDDSEAVVGNKDLDPSRPLSDLLVHDFWGKKLTNTSHKSYRPLTILTFRWNYWLAGGLHPVGFHLANLFLHGVVCAILLDVFTLIFNGPSRFPTERSTGSHRGRDCGNSTRRADPLAFLCSLLFAVHPVHTESVAGIVGRADLLCALFFILSFLAYIKGCTQTQAIRPDRFSMPWLVVSTLFCGLATFSKEQGITVIGVSCAYDVICICEIDLAEVMGIRKSLPLSSSSSSNSHASSSSNGVSKSCNGSSAKETHGSWMSSLWKRVLFLAVSAVALLTVRWRIMGSAPPTFMVHDNPHSFVNGTLYRTLNYNYLYAINAWILLSPHWLCFDWSMGCVPTITSITDPRIIVVFAFWSILGLLAWVCLKGLDKQSSRPVTMGVVLVVVPFLPATNLLFRVGFVIAERVLYLPSAGFCVLVCHGVRSLCQRQGIGKKVIASFFILLALLAARSVHRSFHWKSEMSLFKAGEKVCPLNAKVHYNIGKLTGDAGDSQGAIVRYRLAIELNPVYDQAMNNLANILKDDGNLLESESLLDKAVEITPTFSSGWMNRGITKAALGKFKEGEESYWKAIEIRKNYPDCYYNLGNLYLEMKRHQEALTAFLNATNLKPTHWNSWNNAIILLDNLGKYDQAIQMGLQALQHVPDNPSILYSLGNAYGKNSDYPNSEKLFLRAISVDNKNSGLYQNLGVVYHRWNKYDKALEAYQKAYQLKPDSPALLDNMNMLKRQMNKES